MNTVLNALLRNDRDDFRRLIESNAPLDECDSEGRSALMHAVIDGQDWAVLALLGNGASPRLSDLNGLTALHFSALHFRSMLAHWLIEAGCEIDAVDHFGNTPLWRAVFESRGRGEMVMLLLEAGADPHRNNISGVSPLDLAKTIANYDVVQFFSQFLASHPQRTSR